ncbi:MAG: protease modulator HflK [Verrucomicrobiota bacterium]
MTSPADISRPRALMLVFLLVFTAAVSLAAFLAQRTGIRLFAALATLSAWAMVVALGNLLPPLPWRLRSVARLLAALAVVGFPVWFYHLQRGAFAGATDALLQFAAVTGAILAFGAHFLATYGHNVGRETPSPVLATLVPLARLLAAAETVTVVVLLVRLYAQRSWFHTAELALLIAAGALLLEAGLHRIARLYQPKRLRDVEQVFGRSVLLPTLFGESGPLRSLGATLEKTFGVKLADTWLIQLGRMLVAPLVLLGALGLWASTALTRVPIDSRGVLVQGGAFAAESLPPGLHFHAPWPWAKIVLVPTERVQELALGFERDLSGPVLWAEKHFEGEQNLLVGQGEELLTINVPIHYRVRDAVAFLRHTSDARAALEALGYRELLQLTGKHTAFGLMTTDRIEITDTLRARLQAASDRLNLGIEVIFVGLKDVHPPVPVAPSYQDVISAEEQRAAFVDLARTYTVQATAAGQVSAAQIRLRAETAATERLAKARGEAARFVAPLAVYRSQPEVYQLRTRLESLEVALAEIRQLVLVPRETKARMNFYLGLDPSSPLSPALVR